MNRRMEEAEKKRFCGAGANHQETQSSNGTSKSILSGRKLFHHYAKKDAQAEPFFFGLSSNVEASMTVEAAVLLPLFLMLMLNLLSILSVYQLHSAVAGAFWKCGRETAKYKALEYYGEEMISEHLPDSFLEDGEDLAESLFVQRQVRESLSRMDLWTKIVSLEEAGLVIDTQFDEPANGMFRFQCDYTVHPVVAALTPMYHHVRNHYMTHDWTGYDLESAWGITEEELAEGYVYVTESGEAYHESRGCSYLNPSIQLVYGNDLLQKRNLDGSRYQACPLCKGKESGNIFYITDYGEKYHANIACQGLKRTIREIKRSEIGGKMPCSKCVGA